MEIFFATLIKGTGYGTHVRVDMEFVDAGAVDRYEEVVPGIGLLFKDSIEDIFKEGGVFIKKAIIDNYDVIKNKINTPRVLLVSKATADRVDYQPIAFLGATIKWLNEYFGTTIKIPEYTYDRDTRTLGILPRS